jgi:N-methylhydantoinase A
MAGVVVPAYGGVLSAVGLLLARPAADAAISTMGMHASSASLEQAAATVERSARRILEEAGHVPTNTEYVADVRYEGQAHEIAVEYEPGQAIEDIASQFHLLHESRNGYNRPNEPIEIVTMRARASAEPNLNIGDLGQSRAPVPSVSSTRPVFYSEESETAAVRHRDSLGVGDTLVGPAIVEEDEATTVLVPGDRATVLPTGALEITW